MLTLSSTVSIGFAAQNVPRCFNQPHINPRSIILLKKLPESEPLIGIPTPIARPRMIAVNQLKAWLYAIAAITIDKPTSITGDVPIDSRMSGRSVCSFQRNAISALPIAISKNAHPIPTAQIRVIGGTDITVIKSTSSNKKTM